MTVVEGVHVDHGVRLHHGWLLLVVPVLHSSLARERQSDLFHHCIAERPLEGKKETWWGREKAKEEVSTPMSNQCDGQTANALTVGSGSNMN